MNRGISGLMRRTLSGISALAAFVFVTIDPTADKVAVLDQSTGDTKALLVQDLVRSVPGMVIDRAYAEYTTNADLTPAIPGDDTIPQNSEGTQIASVSITPKSTTNRIRLRATIQFSQSSTQLALAALFENSVANALSATVSNGVSAANAMTMSLEYEKVPGSTSTQTYNLRIGPTSGTMRANGLTSGRLLGGACRATLIVEEIVA